jgi:hypothetical protein
VVSYLNIKKGCISGYKVNEMSFLRFNDNKLMLNHLSNCLKDSIAPFFKIFRSRDCYKYTGIVSKENGYRIIDESTRKIVDIN